MSERKMWPIKCADCGKDAEVPFEPKTDRFRNRSHGFEQCARIVRDRKIT